MDKVRVLRLGRLRQLRRSFVCSVGRWLILSVIGQRGVELEVLGWLLVVMELVRAARDDFVRLALAVGRRRLDAVAVVVVEAALLTVG